VSIGFTFVRAEESTYVSLSASHNCAVADFPTGCSLSGKLLLTAAKFQED
jgi:hypothetical protein